MEEDQEWSDSSYILRRKYRLNWTAIIRNVPEGLEGLFETFSRWSVSLGFSLPNLVEDLEELCIQKGVKHAYRVSFPSRSSTRSFIRLSRRNIWKDISSESYSELYVYCDPAYKLRPFLDFQTMNLSTCYWIIRGISKDIENEEAIWELIGRRNPYGEFLRRVVYIRDEEGSNGFCFLQFSSPLTSYRALKWELKHDNGFDRAQSKSKYLVPEFVGTSHVKALLLLFRGLDKFETRTLKTVESSLNYLKDLENLNDKNISNRRILQGYLDFWKRSKNVEVPVDRNLEFQYNGDERYKSMYKDTLNSNGIAIFPKGHTKLYYCKSLDLLWDWDIRVFMDCQSNSLFEFDSELQSLRFLNNSEKSCHYSNFELVSSFENSASKSIQEGEKRPISQEKLRKEREIRVASFLETTRSQLNYNKNNNNLNNSYLQDSNVILEDEYDSKRQKITQFFDTSSNATHENSFISKKPNSYYPEYNNSCKVDACEVPAETNLTCGAGASSVCKWSISDGGVTEGTIGEELSNIKIGKGDENFSEEELICFVCCRVFGSMWEKVNHEQKSLLHKYNLEIWRDESQF